MRLLLLGVIAVCACQRRVELLPPDDAGSMSFGAACSGSCLNGLTCFTMAGTPGNMAVLQDGLCSRTCAGPSDCPADTLCGTVEGMMLCLSSCNPSATVGCRSGYSCCSDKAIVTGPGACGPTSSNFCGN